MKALSIRETRAALPKLERLLAKHGRIEIRRRGKPIAHIDAVHRPVRFPALDEFRATLPPQRTPSEVLLRAERDSR